MNIGEQQMLSVTVYSTKTCTNCPILKDLLESNNIPFTEKDMATPESLTELTMFGIFARMAPVLRIGDKFYYKEIIDTGKLNFDKVREIIKTLKA